MAKVGAEGAGVTDFEERDYQAAWSDLSHQAFGEGGLMEQRDSARSEVRQLRTEIERLQTALRLLLNECCDAERLGHTFCENVCHIQAREALGQPKDAGSK